jgi:hypothetical protein
MRTVFADSFYFLALWNAEDRGHGKALAFTSGYREAMLTTGTERPKRDADSPLVTEQGR